MFDRISRSWSLVKASAAVLRSDKELLLFPVISAIATVLVAATFMLPLFGLGLLDGREPGPGLYLLGFLFYLCQYFVIFFFNTALVGAAMIRLEGGDPTVSDGLRIARERMGAILGYAAIAATVGLVLRALEERAGFLGRIVIGLIGLAWTLATFLVVPVLVSQNVGPIEALKESVRLLKRSWGENLAGNVGIGLAFGLITAVVAIVSIVLVIGAARTGGAPLAIPVMAIAVLAVAFIGVVQAALTGVYSAALYRYAVDGHAPAGFDDGTLQAAFVRK